MCQQLKWTWLSGCHKAPDLQIISSGIVVSLWLTPLAVQCSVLKICNCHVTAGAAVTKCNVYTAHSLAAVQRKIRPQGYQGFTPSCTKMLTRCHILNLLCPSGEGRCILCSFCRNDLNSPGFYFLSHTHVVAAAAGCVGVLLTCCAM